MTPVLPNSGEAGKVVHCQASELRPGDTFYSFAGPRVLRTVRHLPDPRRRRVVLEWDGGSAELEGIGTVRAIPAPRPNTRGGG
jgi:hypothetical protein